MAKQFSSQEVKLLVEKHTRRLNELKAAGNISEQCLKQIKAASDALAMQEVMGVLRGVPVDEIARQKKGLKIKPLYDYGYRTLADIYAATPYALASVKGISQDTAHTIKGIAKDFAKKALKEAHIRLSTDNKTKQATDLVKSIYAYRQSQELGASCNGYLDEYEEQIGDLCQLVAPGQSALRWLFSSKAAKERITSAYQELSELLRGDYGIRTKQLLNGLKRVSYVRAEDAWADFAEQSPAYFSVLEDVDPGLLGTSDAVYGLPEELA